MRTHWEGCWNGGPQHYECAVAVIEDARQAQKKAESEVDRMSQQLAAAQAQITSFYLGSPEVRLRDMAYERDALQAEVERLRSGRDELERANGELTFEISRLYACRDELREVTEAMDAPAVNNTVTLKDAVYALLAERDALRAERDVWRGRTICADDERDRLRAEVERLQAELIQTRLDAARYRWLRAVEGWDDAAIDAARGES